MECRAVKLQLWQQNGSCDSQEESGSGWREVAGCCECGIERVDAIKLVSFVGFLESGKVAYYLG